MTAIGWETEAPTWKASHERIQAYTCRTLDQDLLAKIARKVDIQHDTNTIDTKRRDI